MPSSSEPATSRRSFLTGFASLLAAPAIVKASSLMAVKAWAPKPYQLEMYGGGGGGGKSLTLDMLREAIHILDNNEVPYEERCVAAWHPARGTVIIGSACNRPSLQLDGGKAAACEPVRPSALRNVVPHARDDRPARAVPAAVAGDR